MLQSLCNFCQVCPVFVQPIETERLCSVHFIRLVFHLWLWFFSASIKFWIQMKEPISGTCLVFMEPLLGVCLWVQTYFWGLQWKSMLISMNLIGKYCDKRALPLFTFNDLQFDLNLYQDQFVSPAYPCSFSDQIRFLCPFIDSRLSDLLLGSLP